MSGGAYDYVHGRVDEFARLIEQGVTWDGQRVHAPHPIRLEFAAHLRKVAAAMEAIELVDSYDRDTPHDVQAIEAVLAKPAPLPVLAAPAKPRKQVTWGRDDEYAEMPVTTADLKTDIGARNQLLEHALITMAVGWTKAPSGKRRISREEFKEVARSLCNRLELDWSGLSYVGVDLDRHELAGRTA